MATPDIGTTINDGYRRGFDRLATIAPSALVPAVIVGVAAGALALLQDVLDSTTVILLLGAVSTAIQVAVTMGATAVFGGALHRARHAGDVDAAEVPEPGAVFAALTSAISSLMPKLGIIVLLAVAPALGFIVDAVLGALVTIVVLVLLFYFGIRWIYAPIIAGSGEATGDEAFLRSEQSVDGSFWGTFGCFFVIGIAIGLPVAVVSGLIGWVLPTDFLSAFGSTAVSTLGAIALTATALESAWAQVEDAPKQDPSANANFDAFGTPTGGAADPTVAPAVAPAGAAGSAPASEFDDLLEDSEDEAPPKS